MTNVAILISGGGTNLQAIIDAKKAGALPEANLSLVVSNRKAAYGMVRAKEAGIPVSYLPTVRYESQEA